MDEAAFSRGISRGITARGRAGSSSVWRENTGLAVARDRDDVLFEVSDSDGPRYAVVHLIGTGKQETSGKFPWTEFFDSLDQWLEYMRADHADYTYGDEAPESSS
jgi:hypothetical protein